MGCRHILWRGTILNDYLDQVIKRFEEHVLPVMKKSGNVEVLAEWGKRACQIEALHERHDELSPICLVGQAGLGTRGLRDSRSFHRWDI